MSLTTRTIVGQIVYGDGTGGSGTLRFTPEALIAVEGKVLLPGPVIVIAGNGGTFEVDLVVTDAEGYNPENWVWRVEESFPGGRTFLFELPSGQEPIPYTQLIPTAPIADPQAAHEHTQYITFDDVGEIVAGVNTVNGLSGDVTLTASDVGAYPDDNPSGFVDASGASQAAPVQSVNGETGAVTIGASDVGAYPDTNPSGFIDASGAPVQSVNSQTGDVTLGAADVGAYPDDNPDGFVNSSEAAAASPVQSVNSQTGEVSLSASDVGAYPDTNPDAYVDAQGAADAAPVQSVNGETGEVDLSASDVGALPDDAALDDLSDVDVAAASADDLLAYDGSDWVATDSPSVSKVSFDTATPGTLDAAGDVAWDDLDQALSYRANGITVDIAQENLIYVRNPPNNTPIPKGAAVSFAGASANRIEVALCDASVGGAGCATAGVALTAIPSPGFGFISTFGLIRDFNTNNILTDGGPAVAPGQELFISDTPGVIATFPQPSPGRRVTVGYVVTTGNEGSIFVTVRRGLTVNELDNVLAGSPTDGQTLAYNASQDVWENVTPTPAPVDSVNGQTGEVVIDASDVGAYPDENPDGFVDAAGAATAAPVQSVNGETGTVSLDASDVGAYPDDNPDSFVDAAGAANAAPVQSVNGETGTVSLTASDVGAYPDDNPDGFVDAAGAASAAPVQSVNGETGTVSLTAADVGAYPDDNPDSFVDAAGAAAAAPVQSVNGETGTVSLTASDVGAYPDDNPDSFVDATGAAAAAPVQSVNGETGTVSLTASDVDALPDDAVLDDLANVSVPTPNDGDALTFDSGSGSWIAAAIQANGNGNGNGNGEGFEFEGEWDSNVSYDEGDIVSETDFQQAQGALVNAHYSLYRARDAVQPFGRSPKLNPEEWELITGFERTFVQLNYVGEVDPQTFEFSFFDVFHTGPGTGLFFWGGQPIPLNALPGGPLPFTGATFADPVEWEPGEFQEGDLVEQTFMAFTVVWYATTTTSQEPGGSDWLFVDVNGRVLNPIPLGSINNLSDVFYDPQNTNNGDVLTWNAAFQSWEAAPGGGAAPSQSPVFMYGNQFDIELEGNGETMLSHRSESFQDINPVYLTQPGVADVTLTVFDPQAPSDARIIEYVWYVNGSFASTELSENVLSASTNLTDFDAELVVFEDMDSFTPNIIQVKLTHNTNREFEEFAVFVSVQPRGFAEISPVSEPSGNGE